MLYIENPSDLPDVKDGTLILFLIGILSYFLGSFFVRNKSLKKNTEIVYVDNFSNKQLILITQIIGTLVSIYLGSFGLAAIIAGQDLTFIRYTLRLITLEKSINAILLTYVSVPIMYFSITYTCAQFAAKNFSHLVKWSAFFSLVMMIMELLTTGGRMGMFYAVTCFFIAFFENRKLSALKGNKRSILPIIIILVMGVGMMFMMAQNRSGDGVDSTTEYLYGPISCFDIDKELFDQPSFQHTYGLLTLQGFISPFSKILMFSETATWKNLDKVSALIDDVVDLNGRDFNSEVTMFGYFYFDGGLFGVFIFSFILGYLSQYLYQRFCSYNKIEISFLFLYMIVVGNVALSFLHISFTAVGFSLSIVLLYFFKKKTQKRNKYGYSSISCNAKTNKI